MNKTLQAFAIVTGIAASSCAAPSPTEASAPLADAVPATCAPVSTPFTGLLCPQRDGRRHPAIVIFGGYGGDSLAQRFAREFAAREYVAASVAYYGVPGAPPTLVDVPVEIGVGAIRAVAGREDVDGAKVAIMGTSKGGEYALLVASATPAVKAVIANVPSPFAWFGLGDGGAPTGCSWSNNGVPLPCVPPDADAGREVWESMTSGKPVSFRPSYEASRHDAALVRGAFFPLERIAGPVLCLAGGDDRVWNSGAYCDLAMDYLHEHHHRFADRAISYPGAGHLFIMAGAGPRAAMNTVPMGTAQMAFGGTPSADAEAARAAWAEIRDFLSKVATP